MTLGLEANIILGIIFTMMIADVVYDGAWLNLQAAEDPAGASFRGWEPVGSAFAVACHPQSCQVDRRR